MAPDAHHHGPGHQRRGHERLRLLPEDTGKAAEQAEQAKGAQAGDAAAFRQRALPPATLQPDEQADGEAEAERAVIFEAERLHGAVLAGLRASGKYGDARMRLIPVKASPPAAA